MLATVTRNGAEVGVFSAPSLPFEIEIALDVLEEIRHRAEEGFLRIGHGGLEFGGVLYGQFSGSVLRILEWRELEIEHALGPSFVLGEADKRQLESMIRQPEPALAGLEAAGWWVSHGRGEVDLRAQDVELHEALFPRPFHVALVIKPVRMAPALAWFFGRNAEGAVPAAAGAPPVELRSNASALIRPPRATAARRTLGGGPAQATGQAPLAPPRPMGARRQEPFPESSSAAPPAGPIGSSSASPAAEPGTASSQPLESIPAFLEAVPPAGRGFRWGLFSVLALVSILVFSFALYLPRLIPTGSSSLGLRIEENGNLLQVLWNQSSPRVLSADSGSLQITDGGNVQDIRLDREELAAGTLSYLRSGGDVKVSLRLMDGGRVAAEEFTRYLGPATAPGGSSAGSPAGGGEAVRTEMRAEERRLDEALRQEAIRKQRLEESIRILEKQLPNR